MDLEEIWRSIEFTENLTSDNIKLLTQLPDLPAGMFEDIADGFEFVFTLNKWEEHDHRRRTRGGWWGSSPPWIRRLPLDAIQSLEWWIMRIDAKLNFEAKKELLISNGFITADLSKLIHLMQSLKREDLADRIATHQFLFTDMPDNLFIRKLKKEVDTQAKDLVQ